MTESNKVFISCLLCTTDAASSSATYSQCNNGGVDPTDPLLFTCKLKVVHYLRIVLPTCYWESISLGSTLAKLVLPAGFTAVSLDIKQYNSSSRNISLSLSIANASLLNGNVIRCEDSYGNAVKTSCPLASELVYIVWLYMYICTFVSTKYYKAIGTAKPALFILWLNLLANNNVIMLLFSDTRRFMIE